MTIISTILQKANFHDTNVDGKRVQSADYWRPNDDIGFNYPAYHSGLAINLRLGGNRLVMYNVNKHRRGQFGTDRKREAMAGFTKSSGHRMQRYLRECTSIYRTFVTLTYPAADGYGYDGRKAKRDLKVFCQRLQRKSKTAEKFSVFWFLEFQENNSIHFHLFTTEKFIDYQWVASNWFEIVGSNLQKHANSGTSIEKIHKNRHGMISYARKYAEKQHQKAIPPGMENIGRFWGIMGNRCVEAATVEIRDSIRFNNPKFDNKERKLLENLSEIVEAGYRKGSVREYAVLLPDKNGERTRDIGVRCWDLHNGALIHRVTKLINDFLQETGQQTITNRGWSCRSSVRTGRTGQNQECLPSVTPPE